VHRLGQLTNKPANSTLHIHPVLNNTSEFGVNDAEISTISSLARKKIFRHEQGGRETGNRRYDAAQWHSDIQFEPVPADYTSLRLTQLPETGGDTLWASGYEIYDRFSKAYQQFFEGLTATFVGDGFIRAAEADPERVKLYEKERGSPKNVGKELKAIHPVVRTNPVTGWKSIFALGPFPKYINELNDEESSELLKKFRSVITENHDLQVRLKWKNPNDLGTFLFSITSLGTVLDDFLAIWDNRSAFHSATFDYDGLGERFGNRAVGIGEAPYLDTQSCSRTEALLAGKRGVEYGAAKDVDTSLTITA
jgi:alpha-ketoglutarate-dependent taurine dioxygenase